MDYYWIKRILAVASLEQFSNDRYDQGDNIEIILRYVAELLHVFDDCRVARRARHPAWSECEKAGDLLAIADNWAIQRLLGRLDYNMRTARPLAGRAPHLSPIRLTGVKTMTIRSALSGVAPARAAFTSNCSSIVSPSQSIAPESAPNCAPANLNQSLRLALLTAGLLLAAVSIALAASAGWHRGATQLESIVWSAAGCALAIVSLTGLSAALACSSTTRRAALTAWLLSLTFVIIAGLGSQHGGREAATRLDSAATGDRARHEAAYKLASDELAALPAARPVGVLETELAAILKDTRLGDCRGWLESKRLRTVCVERVEPLRTELATAQARSKVQDAMSTAAAALATNKPTTPANSDAAALMRYIAALGIVLPVDRLADMISLLTVVAIEVVGAVALALGRRQPVTQSSAAAMDDQARPRDGGALVPSAPVNVPPALGVQALNLRALNVEPSDTIERLKARILGDLERGPRACSQRALAGELGVSVGYVNKALKELANGGRVNVLASREGTKLELASA